LDDTTSKKAHNEQAAYMFGFKCFLYTSSTDDLLCYPAVALAGGNVLPLTAMARATFKLKAKAEQQLLMKDVGIKYDRFLAVDNDVAFTAWGEFLCTRTRRSNDAGREITIAAKSIESYNTAMVNDIKRSKLQPSASYYEARASLMKRFGKQEAIYRTKGLIKAQVGSDVVPLDLHDLLCERLAQENDPKLVKLHLIMLLAFDMGVRRRGMCACIRPACSCVHDT
jgi:hypothetical protein